MSAVLYDVPGPAARRRAVIGSLIGGGGIAVVLAVSLLALTERGALDIDRWQVLFDPPGSSTGADVWTSLLITGLGATLRAAVLAAVLALALGLILVIVRSMSAPAVRYPAIAVIELFRGIPVVLLMFFGVVGLGLPIFHGVVFGLMVYNAAVIAEILRAGIVSLPRGQLEAGHSIGLTQGQTLFMVLLPQAVRRMLPSLVSQLVVLLKDTSLGFIIGYAELLRVVRLNGEFFGNRYVLQLFAAGAVIYIVINFALSRLATWLDQRGQKKAAKAGAC